MAQQTVHERTLLHLVPENIEANNALQHPDNARFVSRTAAGTLGLEIGFHIPPFSRGHVITRLGRNADLILSKSHSGVHVAFEIHPDTLVVMLSLRTKHEGSVFVSEITHTNDLLAPVNVNGDCVLFYGVTYLIAIASYEFRLEWRDVFAEVSKAKTVAGFQDSMRRLKDVRSRDQSLPGGSANASWYMTRLRSSKEPLVREQASIPRVKIGEGGFGKVYKTLDSNSGHPIAVKVVNLRQHIGNMGITVDYARALLHSEVKILETLSHDHIIKCLGLRDFHTDTPLIYMPLCQGDARSIIEKIGDWEDQRIGTICNQILKESLSALDYTATLGLCHRDVKPDNILYTQLGPERYRFMLADFGLSKHSSKATTNCGTDMYKAPEVLAGQPQDPKVDVWSLFATIATLHPKFVYPPANLRLENVVATVRAEALKAPEMRPMVRINPERRASAAQMLVLLFNGEGLTTMRGQVPPITPDDDDQRQAMVPPPAPQRQLPSRAARPDPLIVYRRSRDRRQRPPARRAQAPGLLPNQLRRQGDAPPPPTIPAHLRGGITRRAAVGDSPVSPNRLAVPSMGYSTRMEWEPSV